MNSNKLVIFLLLIIATAILYLVSHNKSEKKAEVGKEKIKIERQKQQEKKNSENNIGSGFNKPLPKSDNENSIFFNSEFGQQ